MFFIHQINSPLNIMSSHLPGYFAGGTNAQMNRIPAKYFSL